MKNKEARKTPQEVLFLSTSETENAKTTDHAGPDGDVFSYKKEINPESRDLSISPALITIEPLLSGEFAIPTNLR